MSFRLRVLVSLMTASLALLGGCGGDSGGGDSGSGVPSASNPAITPPPATAVAINTGTGAATANQTVAATALESLDGAGTQTLGALTGAVGVEVQANAETTRLTIGEIVRRHAEKLKDRRTGSTVAGAVITSTFECFDGGSQTFVFDDASGNSSQVFVNCNEGGAVMHGTVSSSNITFSQSFGATVGSPYSMTVSGTFAIDLSIRTSAPVSTLVTQGSFTFGATFSGTMVAGATGGVEPGFPTRVQISMTGASLLASDGTHTERLSAFNLGFDDDDTLGRTTVTGGYTYASSAIGGAVTVSITTPIVHSPQSAIYPTSGAITIIGTPGKIVVTVISTPVVGVRVDVYANASDVSATNTYNLSWVQVEAL